MSNTLCYQTEVAAFMGNRWERVIAPTNHYKTQLLAIDPSVAVSVVPYGFDPAILRRMDSISRQGWIDEPRIVRLPHRPDRRKGHVVAIEGLARALPDSRNVHLQIAWLDESRYAEFRRELEHLAYKNGIETQVNFEPWMDDDRRWEIISRSCATLQLGSFDESFGLSIVESVLCGRPAITTSQPAAREVLGSTSLHIEIDEPLGWYRQLEGFWNGTRHDYLPSIDSILGTQALDLNLMSARYDELLAQAAAS